MAMSQFVEGGAFKSTTGKYMYVLWAKTRFDNSEYASTTYTFPASFGISSLYKADINFASSALKSLLSSTTLTLTGIPMFFSDTPALFKSRIAARLSIDEDSSSATDTESTSISSDIEFKGFPNPFSTQVTFSFNLATQDVINLNISSISGNQVATVLNDATLEAGNHSILFNNPNLSPGIYFARLSGNKNGNKNIIKLSIE